MSSMHETRNFVIGVITVVLSVIGLAIGLRQCQLAEKQIDKDIAKNEEISQDSSEKKLPPSYDLTSRKKVIVNSSDGFIA